MKRLGYTPICGAGGDWGAVIVDLMGVQAPRNCSESTPNGWRRFHPKLTRRPYRGSAATRPLSEERHAYDGSFLLCKGLAYALEMGNRPQTLYGIQIHCRLAGWILDHDALSYELIARGL